MYLRMHGVDNETRKREGGQEGAAEKRAKEGWTRDGTPLLVETNLSYDPI